MGGRGARGLCADNWQVARPVRHQDGGIMARAGVIWPRPPAARRVHACRISMGLSHFIIWLAPQLMKCISVGPGSEGEAS